MGITANVLELLPCDYYVVLIWLLYFSLYSFLISLCSSSFSAPCVSDGIPQETAWRDPPFTTLWRQSQPLLWFGYRWCTDGSQHPSAAQAQILKAQHNYPDSTSPSPFIHNTVTEPHCTYVWTQFPKMLYFPVFSIEKEIIYFLLLLLKAEVTVGSLHRQ